MKLRYFYKTNKKREPIPFSNLKRKSKPIGKRWQEIEKSCCTKIEIGCTCDFRYFVQINSEGVPVDGTLIKRKKYPEMTDNIRFMELPWNLCCDNSVVEPVVPEVPEEV